MDNNILTSEQISLKNGLCTCDKAYKLRGLSAPDCPWHSLAVEEAMEEYKDLHTSSLREELEKLRANKESLFVRVEEVREIKKQLEHEMLLVKRNNKDLEAENEKLKKAISDYSSQVCDLQDEQENLSNENYGIMVENQKLREALEWYANSGNYLSLENVISKRHTFEVERRAKEALKGGLDE